MRVLGISVLLVVVAAVVVAPCLLTATVVDNIAATVAAGVGIAVANVTALPFPASHFPLILSLFSPSLTSSWSSRS